MSLQSGIAAMETLENVAFSLIPYLKKGGVRGETLIICVKHGC